jgi:hypothetical protein
VAEAEFQQIVDPIVDGKTDTLAPERKAASDRICALWHRRSRYRELESQEVQLNGNVGNDLTKEQEENLEKNGYMFARKSGIMPARQLNGLELQLQIDNYARDLAAGATRWGSSRRNPASSSCPTFRRMASLRLRHALRSYNPHPTG